MNIIGCRESLASSTRSPVHQLRGELVPRRVVRAVPTPCERTSRQVLVPEACKTMSFKAFR